MPTLTARRFQQVQNPPRFLYQEAKRPPFQILEKPGMLRILRTESLEKPTPIAHLIQVAHNLIPQ